MEAGQVDICHRRADTDHVQYMGVWVYMDHIHFDMDHEQVRAI